jgi:hypothetical protein
VLGLLQSTARAAATAGALRLLLASMEAQGRLRQLPALSGVQQQQRALAASLQQQQQQLWTSRLGQQALLTWCLQQVQRRGSICLLMLPCARRQQQLAWLWQGVCVAVWQA